MYTFCDDYYVLPNGAFNSPAYELLHDEESDHPHNMVCGRKSAWQILREHPDFDPGTQNIEYNVCTGPVDQRRKNRESRI